jgi:prepilin-type N-terminal cleavage/methylation domain-containing protein
MVRVAMSPRRRGGFTLIELLVVIAIISVLAALTLGGAYNIIQGQRGGRTSDFMRTTDRLLAQHWRKVVEDARKEQGLIVEGSPVMTLAGNDRDRAMIIWIKLRLMEAFPQSYAEIQTPWPYNYPSAANPLIPVQYQKYNATYKQGLPATAKATDQSAACLYLILSVNRGATLDQDNNGAFIGVNADGAKQLIDSWGNPLTFIRFPIGTTANPPGATITPFALSTALVADLNVLNPSPTTKTVKGNSGDPDDPEGRLLTPDGAQLWYNTADGKVFQKFVHTVAAPLAGVTAGTQPYFTPVIVSNGADGLLNSPAVAPDDIYSWRLRVGTK